MNDVESFGEWLENQAMETRAICTELAGWRDMWKEQARQYRAAFMFCIRANREYDVHLWEALAECTRLAQDRDEWQERAQNDEQERALNGFQPQQL